MLRNSSEFRRFELQRTRKKMKRSSARCNARKKGNQLRWKGGGGVHDTTILTADDPPHIVGAAFVDGDPAGHNSRSPRVFRGKLCVANQIVVVEDIDIRWRSIRNHDDDAALARLERYQGRGMPDRGPHARGIARGACLDR